MSLVLAPLSGRREESQLEEKRLLLEEREQLHVQLRVIDGVAL
jgi:hypothetical protein